MNSTSQKLQTLDVLKGIGIIMIIIVHNRHFLLQNTDGFRQLINFGQMGCQLFFLVSGMALCYSWKTLSAQHPICCSADFFYNYSQFIKKRYLRLAPGFLFILLINFVLNIFLVDYLSLPCGFIMNRRPTAILANILFLHGLFPSCINNVFPGGWYIGTTFLLYLLFPFIYTLYEVLVRYRHTAIYLIPFVLWGICFCILVVLCHCGVPEINANNNSYLYFSVWNQLPCFCMGITLYHRQQLYSSKRISPKVSAMLFCITAFIAVYCFLSPVYQYSYFMLPTLTGFSFYWLALFLLELEKKDQKISFCPFLVSCGRNSYGMYLVHSFICWYGMKSFSTVLNAHGIMISDLLLYTILLPFTILCVYALGYYMTKFLNRITRML